LLITTLNRLKTHVSDEKGGYLDDDRILVGYLNLTSAIIKIFTEESSYEDMIALIME
jgi:hypothetical protein